MNITLTTKDLTHSNIQDTYYTETKGSNFSTTIGSDPDKGKVNISPMGSTTIGFKDMGSEKEQNTKATIGNGSIVIANNKYDNNNSPITPTPSTQGGMDSNHLSGLNRDTNKSQEITKDMITGALDGSMTIDNRLFTKEGRESIASDVTNFGKNTANAIGGATGSTLNIFETALNTINNGSLKDGVSTWKANQSNLVNGNKISNNDESRETMNNLSEGEGKSQQDIERALNSGFAEYNESGRLSKNVSLYKDKEDEVYGTHNDKTGDSYINTTYNDMTNTYKTIKATGHENSHNYTTNIDKITADNIASGSEKYAVFGYWTGTFANWDFVNNTPSNNNLKNNGSMNQTKWNDKYGNTSQIQQNTSRVQGIRPEDRSDKVTQVARNLDIKTFREYNIDNGKHTYLILEPDNMDDFTPEKMKEQGLDPNKFVFMSLGNGKVGIIIGGYNDESKKTNSDGNNHLVADINNMTDYKITIGMNLGIEGTGFNPESKVIKSEQDISDSKFIYNIMKNTNGYIENQSSNSSWEVKYNMLPTLSCGLNGYNCNSFSNSLLDHSGADKNRDRNFKGIDWGKDTIIPEIYFKKQDSTKINIWNLKIK